MDRKKLIRKLLVILIAVSSVAAFWSVSLASVVGSWDVEGMVTDKIKVKGKSATVKSYEQMLYTFNPDGTFSISFSTTGDITTGDLITIPGIWKQKKNLFYVYTSLGDLGPYIDYLQNAVYTKYGLTVYVFPTSITLNGSEKKNNTIKGTLTFKASVYYVDYQTQAKMSISYPFTGMEQFNSTAYIMRRDDKFLKHSESFMDLIEESIDETVMDNTDDDLEQ